MPSELSETDDEAITSGTPMEFFNECRGFASRGSRMQPDDPVGISETWGLPPRVWHEDWSQASGGEAQRAMIAIAVSLKPDILLLDEPTSYGPLLLGTDCRALDEDAVLLVEKTIRDRRLAALWITHSDEQERRVAVRTIHLGPRERGGNIHSRNTSVNTDVDGDTGSVSGDSSQGVLRKTRSAVKRMQGQSNTNK